MTPERWQKVDEIFQSAIELAPDKRAALLDDSCGDDQELRREVESLIAADDQGLSVVDQPAFQVAAGLMATSECELSDGQSFGHYEIVGLIGIGGMGEVYLARDQVLNRRVALKLLPADYTRHKDRLRRFQQEAQAASALNHPNILTIYEVGQVEGQQFMATEFVEGDTLRQLMKRSRLSLGDTLDIAVQTAGALSAAHRAGIIHRDIKPENIMLRPDGYVKVLDFGLAKLTEQKEPNTPAYSAERVDISSGLVMGTVKYMSPEQAQGQPVDPRSDIFSFGVVLYEMIMGRAPFEGKNSHELISAILKREPLSLTDVPEEIRSVVSKALRKKKEERYQTIEDLLADLKSLKDDKTVRGAGGQTTPRTMRASALATKETAALSTATTIEYVVSGIKRHKTGTVFAVASVAIVSLAVTFGLNRLGKRLRAPSRDVKITRVPELDKAVSVAISPNGKYIAYAERGSIGKPGAGESLWVLNVSTNQREQIVPPTDTFYGSLTYSRDGEAIFYTSNEVLYRIPAAGGQATKVLSDLGDGISFAPDGAQFAFVRGNKEENALMVANVDGTGERILAKRKKPQFFSSFGPAWSPDGSVIVSAAGEGEKNNHAQLIGIDAKSGEGKWATDQTWDEFSGRILWLPDGSGLIAAATQGADEQIWEIPYPAGEAHRITSDPNHGYWDLSLTDDGSSLITIDSAMLSSIWVAPDGNSNAARRITSGEHHLYRNVSWTPDGRILYNSNIGTSRDIWIMNGDGTNPKQLTMDSGINMMPAASADGRYVVFSSNRAQDGAYNLWRIDMDGSNPVQLTHGSGEGQPTCSPDGRWVVYSQGGPNTTPWAKTLWKVSIDGGEPVQLSDKPSSGPSISPDGALIACWYSPEPATQDSRPPLKIALMPFAGGAPISVLDATYVPPPNRVRWTADGQAISFLIKRAQVTNVWNQPVSGGPPKQLTQFTSEEIDGFHWSRDGQLVCARAHSVADVVLISNFK